MSNNKDLENTAKVGDSIDSKELNEIANTAQNSDNDFSHVIEGDFSTTQNAYNRLYNVIKILRGPNGCPWDKEQTPLSMRTDLIEEVFEATEAITQQDSEHTKEELGDVLLNATMIAYMHEQSGKFTVSEVLNELSEKLIRRHPHVFKESSGKVCVEKPVSDSSSVLAQWDRIKQNVEGRKSKCILDDVPKGFPPLLRAYKLQKKASKKGFDWDNIDDVYNKIKEELLEVEQACIMRNKVSQKASESASENSAAFLTTAKVKPLEVSSTAELDNAQLNLESEIGDLLFAVVNYARHLGVDPENALNATNNKFYNRFSYVQQKMEENNIDMIQENLSQMDQYWNEAKEFEKGK